MIGTSLTGQGGITSVINTYMNSEAFKKNDVIYMTAHSEKNRFFKILKFIMALIKLPVYLLNRNIKIVHIHSAQRSSFYRKSIFVLLSRLFGKKVLMHIHGAEFDMFYNNSSAIIKKYIRFILNLTTILALSNEWAKRLKKITGKNNIITIYNPILLPKIKSKINNDKVNILFLGRLGKRKGTYDLLNSIRNLSGVDFELKLCGDGDVEQIKKLIFNYKLEEKIKVLGWVSGNEKEKLLESADIYVLPSYNEGLPMSILEAMTYRLPVVSTTVGGIPEAVEHGKTGFLVKPGDVKNLSKYLNLLISDKGLREKMGAEGYKKAKNTFDVKIIVKQLNEIYKSVEKGEKL